MNSPHMSHNVSPMPASGIATSPLHRQRAVQPPNLLVTSLGNARHAGLGIAGTAQTPLSPTSLSSPFSGNPLSPYLQSPGGAAGGASPMALRSHGSFSGTYNPQQWGPVGNGSALPLSTGEHRQAQSSRVAALAPRPVGPDGMVNPTRCHQSLLTKPPSEPVASPPPPYSPRRDRDSQGSPRRPGNVVSPSDTTSPDTEASHYGTPVSAATTLSPDLLSRYPSGPSPSLPHASPNDSPNIGVGAGTGAPSFPPPPTTQDCGQRNRASTKNHADRLLSSLTLRGKASNAALPIESIDALQQNTTRVLAQASGTSSSDNGFTSAPAARRAASTGCIGIIGGSSRSNSHSPSPTTWEPGMPLPPPPPGPPPPGARSQSLNRPMESPSTGLAPTLPFRQRRPPGSGTALGAVPPTPADWREEEVTVSPEILSPRAKSKGPSPLHIDTGSILHKRRSGADFPQTTTTTTPAHLRRESSAGGLFRSPAVRNRSAKGIRERRNESRNGKGRAFDESAIEPSSAIAPWDDDYDSVKPNDLVLSDPPSKASMYRLLQKSTPKSSKSMQSLDGALNSAELKGASEKAVSFASSRTTPQPESGFSQRFSPSSSTPPFSPGRDALSSPTIAVNSSPPSLSTLLPPATPQRSTGPALSLIVSPGPEQRPVSHLLHIPNSDDSMQVPLTPATIARQEQPEDLLGPESPKAFAARAIERHRVFAEREAAAASNSERLELFVQYMIAESRIRREQYTSIFEEDGIDIDDLTRGLFGHQSTDRDHNERERPLSRADTSKGTSIASSALEDSSSQGNISAVSHIHGSPSSATTHSSTQHRSDSTWWKDYVPCLSPIASMSIVTGQDEMDSRGRASSRWWEEQSRSGDPAQGDAFKVLERSKRESKYMGVPREARTLPAVYESGPSAATDAGWRQSAALSQPLMYGPDEYPPEKVGWPAEGSSAPPPPHLPSTPLSAPYTPDPRKLDISRLVTLPPPYPRHHPAVSNSHPDLADVRAVVRSLSEEEEIVSIRATYDTQILGKRQRADSWCKHQRSLHRQDMEFRMDNGEISQEEYDEAETELEAKLHDSEKHFTQADFDIFQNSVLTPLHAIFSDRIKVATSSLDKLSSRLFSDAQSHSPNLPQEEGDEQPELLEKLTQLKWLFEARENLHRQIYDLLSDRNERYKAIVLLPYKQTQNREKYAEAEQFFAKDAQDRRATLEQAVCTRAQAFLAVVESNVSRGVEAQLSAFWDIAPCLLEVLHKIPHDLEGFEIQIPANEYEENPSYYSHPLQYLYSLLGHTEKSSYQFIESQVNLLCLLHEIRSHTLIARMRVEAQTSDLQRQEERKLTEDLKEKVGLVEGQWEEALGNELMEAREKVRGRLLEEGGWDDEEGEV